MFFPDEGRYYRSLSLFWSLKGYGFRGVLDLLQHSPDHIGFIFVGLPPAAIQIFLTQLTEAPPETTMWIPALYLSAISVACIVVIYGIARRSGALRSEAVLAAALMSLSASMFLYARHLVPYDSSLLLILIALWLGLSGKDSIWRAVLVGAFTGAGLLVYNGYWAIAVVVFLITVLYRPNSLFMSVKRLAGLSAGLVCLPLMFQFLSIFSTTGSFIDGMRNFSQTVVQGDFAEGWFLPWEYFWHTEHLLLLIWLMSALVLPIMLLAWKPDDIRRGLIWLTAIVGIYLLLTVASTVLQRFVVYGRLACQLIPFFSLLTAYVLVQSSNRYRLSYKTGVVGIAAILLVSVANFAPPLMQRYPKEFAAQVAAAYGPVRRAISVIGPKLEEETNSIPPEASQYVLLNAQYLYPIDGISAPPRGRRLVCLPHPIKMLSYQYEGLEPAVRDLVRSSDISMCLIEQS